jgi:hypothetical protein
MTSLLIAEEEGPPTKKKVDPGAICTSPFSHLNGRGQAELHHMSVQSNLFSHPGLTDARALSSHAWGYPNYRASGPRAGILG